MKSSPSRTITGYDKDTADLLAILMKVANSVDQMRQNAGQPLERVLLVALETQAEVLRLADRLYPEAGEMEQRVIDFAIRFGLDLTMQHFPVLSRAIH